MRILSAFTLFIFALLFWGCNDSGFFGGQVCTLVGCEDGVSISISEERPDSLSLTVFINDETDPYGSRECVDERLGCGFWVGGKTPETVRVHIEWDEGEFSENFEPVYEAYQPNGPDCPPTCAMASIEINLFEE